jgi:Secretion system C-terminal sorting domain/SprB repeat
MKKILTLALLTFSLSGFSQQWKMFGTPGQLPVAVDHAFTVLENNRPAVGYILSSLEVEVQAWDGSEWVLLDPPIPGEQASDIDMVHIDNTIYVGFFNETQSKYMVMFWDGTTWQQYGDTGINAPYMSYTASLEVSQSAPDMFLSYIDDGGTVQVRKNTGGNFLGFDTDFVTTPNEVIMASEGNKVYLGSLNGPADNEIWTSAETGGPFSLYGGGAVETTVSFFDIDVNPGAPTGVCYRTTDTPESVNCARTNGTNSFDFEPTLTGNGDLYDMVMAYDANDSMVVAYVDGAGETHVYREDGGAWVDVGVPVMTNFNYPLDIEIFHPSNRPYLTSVESSMPEIRAWNHQPAYLSDAGVIGICQDAGVSTVLTDIQFTDTDHDSVFVKGFSQNVGLIQNANIVITRTNPFDPFSNLNTFSIDVTPETGQSGFCTVDLLAIDGLDTLTHQIVVNVYPQPTANASLDQQICADSPTTSLTGSFNGSTGVLWTSSGTGFFGNTTSAATTYTASGADITAGTVTLTLTTTGNGACAGDSDDMILTINALPNVDGGIDLTVCDGDNVTLSGSGAQIYAWDNGISNAVPFTATSTTTYTVTGTDANGCMNTDQVLVTVNPIPSTPLVTANSPLCEGDNLNLTGTSTGGSTYSWTGPNTFTSTQQNPTIIGVSLAEAGTYSVTATLNGCASLPATSIVSVNPNPPTFTVTSTNPTICSIADGSLLLNGLLPVTNYDIYYSNGSVQGPFGLVSGTGGELTIPGLGAGSFSDITVVNTNGCQTIDAGPYGLSDPSAPTVDAGIDMTICEGEPITLTAVNSENALISWDNGILNGHTFFPTTTTTFTVTASSSGCTATDQVTITVNALPDVTLSVTDATCTAEDGVVTSSISNGLPPYDVYWSNGTTGGDISGLEPALYYINVTDDNGCYTMEVATVSSTAMSITGTKTDNNCPGDANGTVDLTVSGSGPFTYHWSNGDITEDISSLTSGQYEVMVTDQNLCMSNASFLIQEPTAMYGELVSTNATCGLADGSISSTVLGGTPAYAYQWKDDGGVDLTGENASTLSAYGQGAYSLAITDVNGCTHELFGGISENNGPIVTVDSLIASTCANDGTINIDVNSAFAITSYLWNTGATTEDLTPTGAGQYNLTVEDVNGCFGVVAVNLPAVLPTTNDICIVSVDDITNTNLIVWEKPVTDEIAYFNVYRESSIAGMFQLVDSISYSQVSEYNDTIAYPGLRSWRYRLGTVDTCGNESILSEPHKTMHITYNESSGVYNLAWDHYEGFPYSTYYIWEHTDALGWTEIDQEPTTVTTYTQTPTDIVGIDYRVTINPPSTCTSTYKATDYNSSRSNKSEKSGATTNGPDDIGFEEANIEFEVYPNPSEGLFKIDMGEFNTYDLRIFDISGKVVYSETINSQNALVDISHLESGAYLIKIKSNEGEGIKQLIKH